MPLTAEQALLVATLEENMVARQSREKDEWKEVAGRGRVIKEGVTIAVSLVAMVFVAATYFLETRAKPTKEQVQEAIVESVAPMVAKVETDGAALNSEIVERKAEAADMRLDLTRIKTDVAKVEKVQDVILRQNAHMGDVLDHTARKKRGPVPGKPQSLTNAELDLLR